MDEFDKRHLYSDGMKRYHVHTVIEMVVTKAHLMRRDPPHRLIE